MAATNGSYNWINALPDLTRLWKTDKDKELVLVGINTSNFRSNYRQAILATLTPGITSPIAQDNESMTWNVWRNQCWPARYIVEQRGNLVLNYAGEDHMTKLSTRSDGS
jgi:hypothetical protein